MTSSPADTVARVEAALRAASVTPASAVVSLSATGVLVFYYAPGERRLVESGEPAADGCVNLAWGDATPLGSSFADVLAALPGAEGSPDLGVVLVEFGWGA